MFDAGGSPAPTLLGREDELARLRAPIDELRPAVMVVVGDPGMGKSELLRSLQAYAQESAWNTVPRDRSVLSIGTHTVRDDLWSWWSGTGAPEPDEWDVDVLTPELDVPELPSGPDLEPWIAAAGYRAPVLVTIDGCQLADELGDWLGGLMREVRDTGVEVVMAIALEPEHVERVSVLSPDVRIELGPLDAEVVRAAILETTASGPELLPTELEQYVEAVRRQPELIPRLLRLLRLAAHPVLTP